MQYGILFSVKLQIGMATLLKILLLNRFFHIPRSISNILRILANCFVLISSISKKKSKRQIDPENAIFASLVFSELKTPKITFQK